MTQAPPGTLSGAHAEKTIAEGLLMRCWRAPCAHSARAAAGLWHTLMLYKYQHCRPSSWRKSQRDSLQRNPTFEFHLQIVVSSRQAQTCTDGPSHQKVKITKLVILGLPFSLGRCAAARFRRHAACVRQQVLPSWTLSLAPSGALVGSSHGPSGVFLEVFLGCPSLWSGAGRSKAGS